ncbi:TPA: DUF1642 domain-containing protein [Streptococcus suis]
MNKQEAINKVKNLSREKNGISRDKGNLDGVGFKDEVNAWDVICILEQLEEPQRVVVPKVVATWIEYCKQSNLDLNNATRYTRVNNAETGVEEWIYENQETFARAWLDGYAIEKEKLYTVEIPNNGGTLILACINHAIKLVDGNKHLPGKFTKESIEYAGFDWALKWAKPAEAE